MEATLTIQELIAKLGGPVAAARVAGVGRTTAYRWSSGARKPCLKHRVAMLEAATATADERLSVLQGDTSALLTRTDGAPVRQVAA